MFHICTMECCFRALNRTELCHLPENGWKIIKKAIIACFLSCVEPRSYTMEVFGKRRGLAEEGEGDGGEHSPQNTWKGHSETYCFAQ